MAVLSGLAGLACLIYYLIIVFHAGITADFAWIWPVGAILLAALAAALRLGVLPVWLRWGLGLLALCALLFFALICSRIVGGMFSEGSEGLDYVVVLGAQVKGQSPSLALTKRLEKGLEYAQKNPDTILILSGGQGSGEEISEAECMRRWLVERGIPESRLILEDRSTTTRENLIFAHELTGCGERRTGIISNNFHIYRAVCLAKALGYQQAEGIAAPSDPLMQAHYVVREVFALVKERLTGNL